MMKLSGQFYLSCIRMILKKRFNEVSLKFLRKLVCEYLKMLQFQFQWISNKEWDLNLHFLLFYFTGCVRRKWQLLNDLNIRNFLPCSLEAINLKPRCWQNCAVLWQEEYISGFSSTFYSFVLRYSPFMNFNVCHKYTWVVLY